MSVYLGSKLVSPQGGFTLAGVVDLLYPIGSIYLSVNNINPGTLFGGTWVAFGSGKTLVGVDPNDTDFDTAEETGGEKVHTLIEDELPNITGDIGTMASVNTFASGIIHDASGAFSPNTSTQKSRTGRPVDGENATSYTKCDLEIGGDQPHNNMPPYITCYMWKRTA